jgi:hypothetical protein
MSVKEFVRRSEIKSRESIRRAYIDIDSCHRELDLLNEQLAKYSNNFASRGGLPPYEKQKRMTEIRERIPEVYNYINYYKECISYEKSEIIRICTTYGFEVNKQYNRDFSEYIPNTKNRVQENDEYNNDEYSDEYDNDDDYESEYSDIQSEVEELEEVEDYKFNPETGTFE